jgi:hypothetical protein
MYFAFRMILLKYTAIISLTANTNCYFYWNKIMFSEYRKLKLYIQADQKDFVPLITV